MLKKENRKETHVSLLPTTDSTRKHHRRGRGWPINVRRPVKTPPATERKCRKCGCTEEHACRGGCYWVQRDLCSTCAKPEDYNDFRVG